MVVDSLSTISDSMMISPVSKGGKDQPSGSSGAGKECMLVDSRVSDCIRRSRVESKK